MSEPALRFKQDDGRAYSAWNHVSINDADIKVIDGDRGTNYPNGDDFSNDGYCLFLNAKNVTKTGFAFDEVSFITNKKDEQLRKGKLKRNDLIITTRGSVGNIALYSDDVAYENIRINSGMVILRIENSQIYSKYLYHFFYSPGFIQSLQKTAFGSAQPQLTVLEIKKFKIGLPSLPEQIKIANFLTAVDEKISQLTQKHNLLNQYKKGVIQQIFSQELRFKDDDGQSFTEWEGKTLDDVALSISNGLSLDQSVERSGYMVTRIETISDKNINLEKVGYVQTEQDISLYKLNVGDILFSNINSISHIGKVVFVDKDYQLYHGMNLLRIVINKKTNNSKFVFYQLSSERMKQNFETKANKAVNQASINQTELKKTELKIPSLSEQTKIANFLTSIDDKVTVTKAQLDAVKQYKQGLLQQMFV